MHSVTAKDLLAAWERGLSQTGARRLLTLLGAVYPHLSEEQLLSLPLGRRDALALDARALLFGSQLVSLAECPTCSEKLELNLDVTDIQVPSTQPPADVLQLECDGYHLEFRLPDSLDLILAESATSVEAAHLFLLDRCLISASCQEQTFNAQALPAAVVNTLENAMSAADPQANIQLDLTCPGCNHQWLAAFDVAAFLWKEINAWAQRVLTEVHLLAQAYAWSEADILAMTPTRRRFYLERIVL